MTCMTPELRANIKAMLTATPAPKHPTRHVIASDGKGQVAKSGNPNWPFASEAMGVSPDQIEDAKAELTAHGLSVDFTPDGRPIATSARHFHNIAKAMGMFHGAHGYGQIDESGRPVNTGREYGKRRERMQENLAEFMETGRCSDESIERQIHQVADSMRDGAY